MYPYGPYSSRTTGTPVPDRLKHQVINYQNFYPDFKFEFLEVYKKIYLLIKEIIYFFRDENEIIFTYIVQVHNFLNKLHI